MPRSFYPRDTEIIVPDDVEVGLMDLDEFYRSMRDFTLAEQRMGRQATADPFGSGQDREVVISGDVKLKRDLHAFNLRVKSNGRLDTNNYRVFVKNQLTIETGAKIHANALLPNNSAGAPAPAQLNGMNGRNIRGGYWSERQSYRGFDGAYARPKLNGSIRSTVAVYGGRGGASGYGGPGGYTANSDWIGNGSFTILWRLRSIDSKIASNFTLGLGEDNVSTQAVAGGPGYPGYGGAGGPSGLVYGGGGGAGGMGGGYCYVSARRIKFNNGGNDIFQAIGGAGGNGYSASASTGGAGGSGGGGGGGVVILQFWEFGFGSTYGGPNPLIDAIRVSGGFGGVTQQLLYGATGNYSPAGSNGSGGENGSFILRCVQSGVYVYGNRVVDSGVTIPYMSQFL